jgi:hypothetical protein
MSARVLFLLPGGVHPRFCNEVPAFRAALDLLRNEFEVELFVSPSLVGEHRVPPTWQGSVQAIADELQPGTHIVVHDGWVSQTLLALSRPSIDVGSISAVGFAIPAATLQALGEHNLAAMEESLRPLRFNPTVNYQSLRPFAEGAPEEEVKAAAERYARFLDHEYFAALLKSWATLNLTRDTPSVRAPALYLNPPEPIGSAIKQAAFLKFVPHAAVANLKLYPTHLNEEGAGQELASHLIPFIKRDSPWHGGLDSAKT